jgi:hypothetical protein
VALQLAIFVEMRFKHELACWRPVNYSPDVQPMITTPGHGSLPMGHAAQAYMTAMILESLADPNGQSPGLSAMLYQQAFRMSFNRIVAGVHFPVDLPPGAILGIALGQYFLRRCTRMNPSQAWALQVPHPGQPPGAPLGRWLFTDNLYNNPANQITAPNFIGRYFAGQTWPMTFPLARATSYLWSIAWHREWQGRQL